MLGIDPATLGSIRRRIGVAGGERKVDAIRGALRGGWINVLITDCLLYTSEIRTLLSGDYDQRDALVTIRSEAGGVDAADFAAMLLRMYLRWAERHNYSVEVYDISYAERCV